MDAASGITTVSVRLPASLHRASREVAERRGISLNSLVRESLEAVVRAEEEKAFFDSFTLLGQDAAECDVEYALPAQREVMLRDVP